MPLHDVADPPHLLLRLTMCSTATSSTTLLPLGELPQPLPVIPSVTILDPYPNFPPFYFVLLVTRSSLVPSRAARTVTKSPDKSPDRPHD